MASRGSARREETADRRRAEATEEPEDGDEDGGGGEDDDNDDDDLSRPHSSGGNGGGNGGSDESNVRIFLRIKPSRKPSGFFSWDEDTSLMEYNIPRDLAAGLINNSRTSYKFRFDAVIGMEAKQDEVFDRVGRPCVLNALNGFNSTVFAYGQTGSGKTFTITGGAERYEDRGLIPRALSMVFDEMKRGNGGNGNGGGGGGGGRQILVHVSYLEIYNNQGYDLLDPNHDATKSLEDLPKVAMLEDADGNCHLRNLSMHLVSSEEDALNLLFLGDTNRAVSETSMNKESSRSHCVFTVALECRRPGSEVVLRSKLHLVDLAGSERAHKTGAKGQVLREATYINTSLHYLEMVIVALHEKNTKGRTHIPYRNSMLTSILRDSLGGNCKTVMIATVSPEREQTDESVSTCRFAQRVARVRNDAHLNEEVDPQVIIRQLKAQVASLTEELALARGEVNEGEALKDYELDKLRARVRDYVNDPEPTAHLNMGEFTYTRMKACMQLLKDMALGAGGASRDAETASVPARKATTAGASVATASGNQHELVQRIHELEQLVQQRDNEIAIMVNMIRKEKGPTAAAAMLPEAVALRQHQRADKSNSNNNNQTSESIGKAPKGGAPGRPEAPTATMSPEMAFVTTFTVDPGVLDDPNRAFEAFKAQYPKNDVIRDNKLVLKRKYDAAKELATVVNDARHQIKHLTLQMDKLRKQQAISESGLLSSDEHKGSGSGSGDVAVPPAMDPAAENRLKDEIEKHKDVYKRGFHDLSELKKEIQHIQKLLEMSRLKLQKDFDAWYQRQGKGALLTETLLLGAPPKAEAASAPIASKAVGGNSNNNQLGHAESKSSSSSRSSSNQDKALELPQRSTTPPRPSTERRSKNDPVTPIRPEQMSPADAKAKPSTPRSSASFAKSSTSGTSSVDEDVSGFYEALDILKRRSQPRK